MFLLSNEKINAEDNKTQSKDITEKDCKDKYVNMAFTDSNYDFIVSETSKLCVNFTSFINHIIHFTSNEEINNFLAQNPFRQGKSSAPKRRENHLKRIYLKLKAENYEKVHTCAEQNESSNTGIVNAMIENYRQKHLQEQ